MWGLLDASPGPPHAYRIHVGGYTIGIMEQNMETTTIGLDYSSFHCLFHYPYIIPISSTILNT